MLFRRDVEQNYPDRIRVVFKHYPLSPSCNPAVSYNLHAFSCDAARAAEAARRLGGSEAFWRMHDQLFLQQVRLDRGPYRELARAAGLDADALEIEMAKPEVGQRIRADTRTSRDSEAATTRRSASMASKNPNPQYAIRVASPA